MKLEPIQDKVEAATDLTSGTDLFIYSMPNSVQTGVMISIDDDSGKADHEIPGRYWTEVQIVSRSSDYIAARDRAYELMNVLRSETVEDYGEYCTNYFRPTTLPIPYRRSDGDLVEFSINFEVLLFTP